MSLLERLNRKNKKYIAMQQAGQRSKNTHGATGFATSVDEAREEIGRASCRERV